MSTKNLAIAMWILALSLNFVSGQGIEIVTANSILIGIIVPVFGFLSAKVG